MDTFTPAFDTDHWSPDKSDLTRWYYDLAKYIKDHPIPGDDTIGKIIDDYLASHPISGDFYSPDNPPPYPVQSVNGQTGNVFVLPGNPNAYSPSTPPPYPVRSVNGQTGDVTIGVPQDVTSRLDGLETQTTQLTNAVGAINDSLPTKYSAINPPPYPVTKVNNNVGDVFVNTYVFANSETKVRISPYSFITILLSGFQINIANFPNFIHVARWDGDVIVGVGASIYIGGGRPLVSLTVRSGAAYIYAYSPSDEPASLNAVTFTLYNFSGDYKEITITTDETYSTSLNMEEGNLNDLHSSDKDITKT